MRWMWSYQSYRLWASFMSVQSTKSFYSVGQNEEQTEWQVCLVDFWSDGKVSMMIMGRFDTEDAACEKWAELDRQKRENEGYL